MGLEMDPFLERFRAGMALGGAGDALGYWKGRWEGCSSGAKVQDELVVIGGLVALKLDPENWPLSDGALMLITTAEALVTGEDSSVYRKTYFWTWVRSNLNETKLYNTILGQRKVTHLRMFQRCFGDH